MPCSWCDFLRRQVQVAERGLALLRKERAFRRGATTLLGCPEVSVASVDQAIVNAEGLLTLSYWKMDEHRLRHHPAAHAAPREGDEAVRAA